MCDPVAVIRITRSINSRLLSARSRSTSRRRASAVAPAAAGAGSGANRRTQSRIKPGSTPMLSEAL
jgi:hypothetical protein